MMMTVQNVQFLSDCPGEILVMDVSIVNATSETLTVSIDGNNSSVVDELNQKQNLAFKPNPATGSCESYAPIANLSRTFLGAHEEFTFNLLVTGKLGPDVKSLYFLVAKAGRITDAKWQINLPPH
ncbi:MAG: hypothetical protein WCF84_14130 [Anaerolineae bacterium]